MMRLVKEEALLDRIRKSWLAFTVNSWGSIKMLTFYWGLLIHMALIFGSYAPHHGLHDLMDGSQSSHDSFEAASDEAARDSFTKFFYHNVLPFVDSAARWMCVGNGCVARAHAQTCCCSTCCPCGNRQEHRNTSTGMSTGNANSTIDLNLGVQKLASRRSASSPLTIHMKPCVRLKCRARCLFPAPTCQS